MSNNFKRAGIKKVSLADHVLENFHIPVDVVDECVNIFFREIIMSLARGENVKISGFGTFVIRDKNQRLGRNPKTKQEYKICARKSISFKTSAVFKKQLNRSN